MKAMTRSTPRVKVDGELALPRQDHLHQRRRRPDTRSSPSALMMPSVSGFTAPPGVSDTLSVRAGAVDQVGRAGAVLLARLLGHQAGIDAAPRHQRVVAALLGDLAAVEHQDAVAIDHARQAVGQDQGRAALHQPVERLLDHRLVLGVDRRQRLVEHQDRRVAQQRAGDGDPLALAARELDALLADRRLVALRQGQDEVVDVGRARGVLEVVVRRRRAGRGGCSPRPCRGTGRCPG